MSDDACRNPRTKRPPLVGRILPFGTLPPLGLFGAHSRHCRGPCAGGFSGARKGRCQGLIRGLREMPLPASGSARLPSLSCAGCAVCGALGDERRGLVDGHSCFVSQPIYSPRYGSCPDLPGPSFGSPIRCVPSPCRIHFSVWKWAGWRVLLGPPDGGVPGGVCPLVAERASVVNYNRAMWGGHIEGMRDGGCSGSSWLDRIRLSSLACSLLGQAVRTTSWRCSSLRCSSLRSRVSVGPSGYRQHQASERFRGNSDWSSMSQHEDFEKGARCCFPRD